MLALGRWKRPRIIAATFALLLLAGCSALRLAYNQADTVLYWWLDSYVEFTPTQAPRARAAIARWFDWHRGSQLADYSRLLERAADEVLHDTTPQRACEWLGEVTTRIDSAVEQALPAVASLAPDLDAAQLQHLRAKQAAVAAEWRDDFLQPDPRERLAAAVKRTVERAEQLYGPLDAGQRQRIAAALIDSPFDAERWIAERERRQRDLAAALQTLQSGALDHAAAVQTLRAVWQRAQQSPDPAYRRYEQRLQASNCELTAQIHNASTSAQRQAAQRQLRAWMQDLHKLSAAGH